MSVHRVKMRETGSHMAEINRKGKVALGYELTSNP